MRKIIPLVVLALLAAGVYGWRQRGSSPSPANAAAPAAVNTQATAVAVEAEPVTVGPLAQEVTAVGALRANESVVLRPEIAGRVARISLEEGAPVRRGQQLLVLDDAVYRAELAQAEANLDRSRRLRDSGSKLFADNYISSTEMDALQTAVKVDEAAVALARARLEKTRITAPFDGVLGLRRVSVGDYLNPGQDIANLEDITPIKLDFRVPETYLAVLRTGQALSVRVDAFPDQVFTGQVVAIDPRVTAEDRSIAIRGELPNADARLRPGLFARVNLVLDTRTEALTVPEQAIVPQGDGHFVYRVVGGKAVRTPVTLGLRQAGRVEILPGLGAGDLVVTAGQLKLADGKPVSVIQPPPAAAAAVAAP
jgi:membrane fusion protein, multidrug efflux system